MSSRDYPSDYKLIRRQYTRDSDDDYVMVSPPQQRATRDYDFGEDRSQVSIASSRDSGTRTTTKTTYGVGRDRTGDAYVSQGRTVVLDSQPRKERGTRPRTPPETVEYEVARSRPTRPARDYELDYEVEKPRRGPDGYYVVETKRSEDRDSYTAPTRRRYRDYEDTERPKTYSRDAGYSTRGPSSSMEGRPSYTRAPRSPSAELVSSRDAVRVTEYEEDRDIRRGRNDAGPPSRTARPRSILRNTRADRNRSPETLRRRRSRSVNFREVDIDGHDVIASRHERPGAEAAIMGKYLSGNDSRPEKFGYEEKRYRREYDRYEDDRYSRADEGRPRRRDDDELAESRAKSYARRERYTTSTGDTDDYGSVLEDYRRADRYR